LNLQKAFENRQDGLWPAFKIGDLALACFQKLSTLLREICYPIGAKDFNSPVFKSFSQTQKLFALNG
jgi:hypothetical protein